MCIAGLRIHLIFNWIRIHFWEKRIRIQLRPNEVDPGGSGSQFLKIFFCKTYNTPTMFFCVIYELVFHVY